MPYLQRYLVLGLVGLVVAKRSAVYTLYTAEKGSCDSSRVDSYRYAYR